MDNLEPLLPRTPEIIIAAVAVLVPVAVFAVSFRRNRLLFDRSISDSCLIALVSAVFWPVWVVASIAAWRQVRANWAEYRRQRDRDPAPASV